MKVNKIKRKYLLFAIIIGLPAFLIAILIYINYKSAISEVNWFCNRFSISCKGKPSVTLLSPSSSPYGTWLGHLKPSAGDIYLSFKKHNASGLEYADVNFIVSWSSKEIEMFDNWGAKFEHRRRYANDLSKKSI